MLFPRVALSACEPVWRAVPSGSLCPGVCLVGQVLLSQPLCPPSPRWTQTQFRVLAPAHRGPGEGGQFQLSREQKYYLAFSFFH